MTPRPVPNEMTFRFIGYNPGDDFEEQILAHRDVCGSECGFVRSQYLHPDYKAFNDEQLSYYLWFRDRFMDGEVLQSDYGYSWLLLVELINDRRDPPRTMDALMRFYHAVQSGATGFSDPFGILDALFSYAAANDLDLPRVRPISPTWQNMLISEILLPYPELLLDEGFEMLVGYPLEDYDDTGSEDLDVDLLFDSSLPAVDDMLRETTGKGILETYGNGTKTRILRLFRSPQLEGMYFHDPTAVITYTEPVCSVNWFLWTMYRYCEKALEVEYGTGKGPSIPSSFGKDVRDVIDGVLNHGDIPDPVYPPKTVRGTLRGIPEGDGPVIVPVSGKAHRHGARFEKDLADHELMEPDGPCGYVPSGCPMPSFEEMAPEAVRYYIYWRSLARRSTYTRTDEGYIWLYECELINSAMPAEEAAEQLRGLALAYDRYFSDVFEEYSGMATPMPGRTYLDYAFVRFSRIPDTTVLSCALSACDMLEAVLCDPEVPVCKENFYFLAGLESSRTSDQEIIAAFDESCARIASRVLRRMNGDGGWDSGRISAYCDAGRTKVEMDVFTDMEYYHWPHGDRDVAARMVVFAPWSDIFVADLRKLLRSISAAVRNRGRKPRTITLFGMDASGIIAQEVERFYSEAARRSAFEESMSMVIDRSEVDRAEFDLKHVTELVGTREDYRTMVEKESVSALVPVSDDPWSDLVSRLDKGQREYLRKALEGTLRSAKPTTEGSINEAAMETVKDAVIEDGKVFDDYVPDLERVLRINAEKIAHREG